VLGLGLALLAPFLVVALAMAGWAPGDDCGSCGREFEHDEKRRRRRVPSAGGRTRFVCQACADAIDEQATLIEPPPRKRRAA
jgi:hypothetical protein